MRSSTLVRDDSHAAIDSALDRHAAPGDDDAYEVGDDDFSCGKLFPRAKPRIWWLLPFIMLFTVGFGGIAVPRVNIYLSLVCRDYFADQSIQDPSISYPPVSLGGDNPQCRIPAVQSQVARFQLSLNLIVGLLSSWISPKLGKLSDRRGRTRFIALNALGVLFNVAIITLVASYPDQIPKNVLFLGSVLEGLGGSFTTAMALFQAYASDCTRFEDRNAAFGLFQGALFFGIALGPTLAAILIKAAGTILIIFYVAMALHATFVLALFFVVPESLSPERQRVARERYRIKSLNFDRSTRSWWKSFNPLKIVAPLSILWPAVGRPSSLFPNSRGATAALRRNILLLASIDAVLFGIAMGAIEVIIIYTGFLLQWGSIETSLFASTIGVVRVFALFIVLPLITRLSRDKPIDGKSIPGAYSSEVIVIRASIVLDIVGYMGYVFARDSSSMVTSGILTSLGAMGSPTLQSALSKHVPQDRIGLLLGTSGLLHALARVVGPTILGLIYSLTVATFPQAVFVCLVSLVCLAFLASLFIQAHVSLDEEPIANPDAETIQETPDERQPLLSR
ncbi:hypothetical protein AOCH_005314 [Aspergillus ochraceoroseus]|uniref:Major facilitator superfamily (MFS) profile domain-containing protein n=2 Tax=Aspergillus ochraceoroseus TaxID=138278 RepID=A0A0F8VAH8_9EURO|nr:hypothetical protein AOCH_005314 [Aspergillus ochraceoroseus]